MTKRIWTASPSYYKANNEELNRADAQHLVQRAEEDGTYMCGQSFPEVSGVGVAW
jgi:hypothetical protein